MILVWNFESWYETWTLNYFFLFAWSVSCVIYFIVYADYNHTRNVHIPFPFDWKLAWIPWLSESSIACFMVGGWIGLGMILEGKIVNFPHVGSCFIEKCILFSSFIFQVWYEHVVIFMNHCLCSCHVYNCQFWWQQIQFFVWIVVNKPYMGYDQKGQCVQNSLAEIGLVYYR